MGEENTAQRRVRTAISKVRRASLTGVLGASSTDKVDDAAVLADGTAWWRAVDRTPTQDEWDAVEAAIRAAERARLAAAVEAKVGFHDPNYNAALWDVIAMING